MTARRTLSCVELRADPGKIFASDQHRRIAAHLGQPRSVTTLLVELHPDPFVLVGESDLHSILKELEADGAVVNVGTVADADALVASVQDHPEAITLPDEQAAILRERAAHPIKAHKYVEGEQWVLTTAGLEKLQAPLPPNEEPPPLAGQALAAAEAANKAMAEADAELERQREEVR